MQYIHNSAFMAINIHFFQRFWPQISFLPKYALPPLMMIMIMLMTMMTVTSSQGMVAGLRPMLLGGWSNRALDSKLQFDDCSVSFFSILSRLAYSLIT